jgi:nucleotidyltransferase/DNA polymerase involved in DNA repair
MDMSAISQSEDTDTSLVKSMPLAKELKRRILSERKLTASIGIASNNQTNP